MNLKKAEKILEKVLNKEWNLGVTFKTENDLLTATADINANAIDDGVFLKVGIFDSSAFFITFVLDKLDYSNYAAKLIYDFNSHSKWLHSYIRDDGYLVIEYAIRFTTEEILADNIDFLLNEFVCDEIMKYLKPLSEITKPAE